MAASAPVMEQRRGHSMWIGVRSCVALAIVTIVAIPAWPAGAVTYFVRGSGNDEADGLTPETAFATIRRAAQLLLEPGDRVVVGPGLYPEANIAPQRNGSPDAPIVFFGDTSGVLTGDLPGAVTIAPSNIVLPKQEETTGFLLSGKHDIVIQGFTIEGAADAGIQARPGFSTGLDSTRITARQNVIRGGRHGIQIVAAGDVSIEGNVLHNQTDVGLSLTSGAEIPLRPLARDNVLERNTFGIVLARTSGGQIVDNQLADNDIAIKLDEARDVSIERNQVFGRTDGRGENLRFVDNEAMSSVRLDTVGSTVFQGNQIGIMTLACDAEGALQLLDNVIASVVEIRGSNQLDVQGNQGRIIDAVTEGAINVRDNDFSGITTFRGKAELQLIGNTGTSIRGTGTIASVADNVCSSRLEVVAETADVRRNAADIMTLFQRDVQEPQGSGEGGTWIVSDSVVGRALTVGTSRSPLSTAIVRGNVLLNGPLQIYSRGALQVSRNEADGIACILSEVAPDLSLTDNTARGSRTSGLIVVGAGNAIVRANASSENMESGLAVRRTKALTVVGNVFRSNGTGGIAVRTISALGGDCNGDGEVTVDEVVVGASIALDRLPLLECDGVDFDGNQLVTIDEVVRAVAGALGFVAPLPPEIAESEVLIEDNTIEDNGEMGIKVLAPGSVTARANRVLRNGGIGIATEVDALDQQVEIVGNTIGSSVAEGILVKGSDGARIRNNFVFSNGQAGILLRDAPDAEVVNNLVYSNGNDGIAVGRGTTLPSPNATLLNNTVYANQGWGVTIGMAGAPSEGTTILNNIFDGNDQGGIAADLGSLGGLSIGFNLNNDGYSHEVAPSVTDFPADPRFVDPAGPDGVLAGGGYEDDNFLLSPSSAAVDAGSATAAQLGITGSAVVGSDVDEGVVDLGFHYGADADLETAGSERSR